MDHGLIQQIKSILSDLDYIQELDGESCNCRYCDHHSEEAHGDIQDIFSNLKVIPGNQYQFNAIRIDKFTHTVQVYAHKTGLLVIPGQYPHLKSFGLDKVLTYLNRGLKI